MECIVEIDEKYVHMAYGLIQGKSSSDDIKALEDLYVLDTILGGKQTCVDLYRLDERLRQEYATIERVESILRGLCCYKISSMSRSIKEDEIISKLKIDRMGIIADALIKHGRETCFDKLFRKWNFSEF